MSQYLIYGKHTKPWKDDKNVWHDPDRNFSALDSRGYRVSKLSNAMSYATREDAQEVIDKKCDKTRGSFEIRKAK